MKYPIAALVIFTLFVSQLKAQSQLRATVADKNGRPVYGVNIMLLDSGGKKLVKATLTDSTGTFSFSPVDNGSYRLRVMHPAYKPYMSPKFDFPGSPLANISLEENAMNEVIVSKQRPLIEIKSDRVVVNVENSIVSAGSTALEVLGRSPGVTVDQNENILLKGRAGVTIMIDGRRVPVAGADLANMLKNMPAGSVDRIEIISNPSARYDAEGNAGIINILTKKGMRMGFNGSANASYGQGIYHKAGAGINMNYRKERINLYGNYNYSNREGFNHLVLTRRYYTGKAFESPFISYDQDHYSVFPFQTHSAGAGIDYKISSRTTTGLNVSGISSLHNSSSVVSSVQTDTNRLRIASFRTANTGKTTWSNFSANAFVKHTIDSAGKEITADLDYAIYPSTNSQLLHTDYFNGEGAPDGLPYILKGDVASMTEIKAFKSDYVHPLSRSTRLEAGVKVSFVKTDNEPIFYDISNADNPIYDTGKSNHYIYRENINAAYLNATKDGEKWSFQGGLRAEQTNVRGLQTITDELMKNTYLKLFPSLGINRKLNPRHDIGLTLSRRIQRPNYFQLNPFRYYMDPSTYTEGTPTLRPATSYSAELSHTFKQQFHTTIGYSITKDVIIEVLLPTPGNITVQTNRNLGTMHYYSLSGAYPFQFFKWWNSVLNFNAYYKRYVGNLANTDLNKGKPAYDCNFTNRFTLPKNMSGEISMNYYSPILEGFMEMETIWMLNLGLQKNVLDKRGTIRLNATDIFWHGYPKAISYYSNYNENFVAYRDTRVVYASLTYRFGKNTVAPIQKRQSGVEEEKSRIGG
jgi:hypothetical protein